MMYDLFVYEDQGIPTVAGEGSLVSGKGFISLGLLDLFVVDTFVEELTDLLAD